MIHLLAAYKIKPDAPAEWWVGNIAPDAPPMTREEKDISHLRNLSHADRELKLRQMADSLEPLDFYNEGELLHLYLDYYWDIEAIHNFYIHDTSGNAFRNYRNEISVAGGWLYHNKEWSRKVWEMMAGMPNKTADEEAFITRNYAWHSNKDNGVEVPTFFTPDYIEDFADRMVKQYKGWLMK